MARLVVCVLALFVASGLAGKPADPVLLKKQVDLMELYYHIHEPIHFEQKKAIANDWNIEKNIDKYSNVTAVKIYVNLMDLGLLPRGVPFAVLEHTSQYEAQLLFNVLYSAKDYDSFYKTAVYLRNIVNEGLFVYALSVAIINRPDTQGIVIPPIYEVFPSFFNNGEIINTAQRINIQGSQYLNYYPSTFQRNNNVVIRWNATAWPYIHEDTPVSYLTHDHAWNAFYYNIHVTYPTWLGADVVPLAKDRRGEWFWFLHKQLLSRYYMERLSNGLGEIPELGNEKVEQGYVSGLTYFNGMPFPERPNNFVLQQPEFANELQEIFTYESRIREAIDLGYYINSLGEHVPLSRPEDIEFLGNLIEANVDSPNPRYYKDFITIWKLLLGNSIGRKHYYYNNDLPITRPSVLEHYQTALRDPAFYMIWKRVLNLFTYWQQQLPLYKRDELVVPQIAIQKVDVDKLMTYFEETYLNITNHLYMNEYESKKVEDDVSVLVQRPQLNHKVFKVRVNVKSEVAKTVVVRFFLAPKYDSLGVEIPLHRNVENFFQIDQFAYDLVQGETVIKRDSTEFFYTIPGWETAHDVYVKAEQALKGSGQFILDSTHNFDRFPNRLLLPKGRVGGMPYIFVVYISEYRAPRVPYASGFDPDLSLGVGSGARHMVDERLGYPFNRPLYKWQVQDAKNLWFQDVLIYHKHTPEIEVPHTE